MEQGHQKVQYIDLKPEVVTGGVRLRAMVSFFVSIAIFIFLGMMLISGCRVRIARTGGTLYTLESGNSNSNVNCYCGTVP